MPKYHVLHITKYDYPFAVSDSANQVILSPKSDENQFVIDEKITITPTANLEYFDDFLENKVGVFTIVEPHHELEIKVELEVETFSNPFKSSALTVEEQWENLKNISMEFPYIDFLKMENFAAKNEVQQLLNTVYSPNKSVETIVFELSSYIYHHFDYRQGVTTVESTLDEIWGLQAGVCQDFAHLLTGILRMLGIPSRYISGYICPSNSEMRGEGATHAWVEVYIPGAGWTGIDPTNNCWTGDRHIKIAFGRDFKDCTPVKGTYKGPSDHQLTVSVIITNELSNQVTTLPTTPVYVSHKPKTEDTPSGNSYRKFIEMQQQQQQQ